MLKHQCACWKYVPRPTRTIDFRQNWLDVGDVKPPGSSSCSILFLVLPSAAQHTQGLVEDIRVALSTKADPNAGLATWVHKR